MMKHIRLCAASVAALTLLVPLSAGAQPAAERGPRSVSAATDVAHSRMCLIILELPGGPILEFHALE